MTGIIEGGIIPRGPQAVLFTDQVAHALHPDHGVIRGQGFQKITDATMDALQEGLIGKISGLNGPAHLGMEKIQIAHDPPADQMGAERSSQLGEFQLVGDRQRRFREQDRGNAGDQSGKIALTPSHAAQSNGNAIGHKVFRTMNLFVLVQQPFIQRLHGRGHFPGGIQNHGVEPLHGSAGKLQFGPGKIIGIQQIELLQGQNQPERVPMGRHGVVQTLFQQHAQDLGVQVPVIPAPDLMADVNSVCLGQGRQSQAKEMGFSGKGIGRNAGQAGGDETGCAGQPVGFEPGQVPGPGGGLKLVQGVQ